MVGERAHLLRLQPANAEVVEDRRLDVGVHLPVVAVGLGDAKLTAVERRDGLDWIECHRTSRRMAAARSHCSWVGTSAKRT